MSNLEDRLLRDMKLLGFPIPEREWVFHPPRRWRLDFAWPGDRVAVEVEGASWANGRHNRGSGFEKDCEKYNILSIDGWRLIRVTSSMIEDGRAVTFIEQALAAALADRESRKGTPAAA